MSFDRQSGIIARYREFLPVTDKTPLVSLHEGNTPLIHAANLSKKLGVELYVKYEGLNPTGSFKDRGMVMAVAKAVEEGSKTIMCASTGNTSAAAAAYAARSGLRCIVLIPSGNIALGKLAQAIAYGAEVIAIDGNFDEALNIVRDITAKEPITLVNSVNPYRIEGQKTAAFEVCDALADAPDILAIPVGNAGNITAYWKGFKEYKEAGKSSRLPHMYGFQAAGAAPLVLGQPVPNPETIATAIRIGNPASKDGALHAISESNGLVDSVTDDEILQAYQLLAKEEGVFCEPASAASLAGIIKLHRANKLPQGVKVACVLTGNGLKDPNIALKLVGEEPRSVPATHEAVMELVRQSGREVVS
ncbi:MULTISPECIES: threonine synthase [Brevibacillus]|jgi:threonine synthase|uniref:Threonine synthase n=1 Tax=Brevibacillus parabrevis TaxID=54914 RepID=A0A4Y3PKK1_BREPA|nr:MULTISPECIES: threonine synthase [Brevibacillus]MBU8714807.1 threonine synthase [Brevibacillus parabrevis]MDH6348770.1 threonine synthase [Brevibacillus sp. 1238]MDR5000665.1 threonine synthase [Brevibacillus parabrevis]MED2253229.1 threonine synthase [Brevibacillus parabrevis]NRQ55588.1 threonine synthase [Brevibacillus sp. HD1.4A]